jgi:hypothetical protein
MHDGDRVAYVGDERDGLEVGDIGVCLLAGSTGSHVRWLTGSRHTQIDLVPNYDLMVEGQAATVMSFDEELVSFQVQAAFASGGAAGVLDQMAQDGHLIGFPTMVGRVSTLARQLVISDPSVQAVLASLDAQQGDEFVAEATLSLLREASLEENP